MLLTALLILSTAVNINANAGNANNILPPVALCKNITVQLGSDGSATIAASDVNDGSYDPDGSIVNLMITPISFNCSNIGANTVTLTVTDNEGLSSECNAIVTVEDKMPPVVNVKPFELVLGSSGTGTLLPVNIDNGSFDNCGPVTLTISKTDFTCSDLGKNIITLTAVDSYGNSASRTTIVTVSSTLEITGMSLTSCDLSPSLALFKANIEGGNGTYTYWWKGLEVASVPFMVIIPFPPSLQFFNTSILEKPFFNNTMSDGLYNIRLVVTDGNACTDTSDIRINKTGLVFNNITQKFTEACEGEIRTYSVNNEPDATYSWTVVNGTILSADQDSNRIDVRWNLGIISGVVTATLHEPNFFFPFGQCESSVVDSVTLTPSPVPALNNPVVNVCSGSENTYTLTGTFAYQFWTITGGTITGGGDVSDNFVTVRWGAGPSGSISVSAGNSSTCTGSIVVNISIFNLSGAITSRTDISCNGGSDGSVTALATAGTGQAPYSYSFDGGAYQPSGTFTGLSLGNHVVTIRDALLCTFELPFVITQPQSVTASIQAQTDVSCFGGSDGSVTISAAGGTPPYQYSLNAGPFQGQNIFNGLTAGTYIITVSDSHNCTGSVTAIITQSAAVINGSVSVINVNCFGDLTGRVDLTVTGGTAPYTFVWSNGATTEDLLNVAAGNYTVVITDSKGCAVTVPAVITQPAAALAGSTIVVNVICFGDATGAVNLTVTGGTAPFTFLWINGAITEDISNLTAGNYTVTITDGNGCTATTSGTVGGPATAVSGSISSQNNVLCKGGNNGSVTIAGAGGTGPYEYRLGAGAYQASGTFGSLTAGVYAITIRDASLCTFSLPVNITEPATALSGSIGSQTDVLCFGAASGSVTLSASGGTSPYQYSLDGVTYQSAATFSNLAAGSYNVAIRDDNLCIFNLPVDITQPASAVDGTIIAQTNVNCFGASTGSVMVSGSGGIAPYTYSVDAGPFQATGTFNSLAAGIHNVTVRDLNMCTFNVPVTITQPASALSVTTSQTNVLCFGESTGSATATPSGGTAPYTLSWNTIPVQTTPSASNLNAGNYTVTVTDNNACVATASVTILQPAGALTAIASVTDVDCFGNSTGAIDLTVTNGTLPILYLWSNGASSEDLAGIPAGTFSVTVTDANGCTANATATVDQPSLLAGNIAVTDVACFGGSTGTGDLTVSGGISPYTYLWSNGAVTQDISGVVSGNYSVTVTDAHGCTVVVNGTLTQPASALSGSIISQSDVTVYGGNDGSVTVSGSGATPPYEYSLDAGIFQLPGTFGTLTAGSYIVTVRDANLCTFDITVTITQPISTLVLNKISQTDVACNGGTTGSVTVEGWGGFTPYMYNINAGAWQPSGTFSSLGAGDYQITVRDASLAVSSISVTITEPEILDLTVSSENILCHGAATGTAIATVTGGVAPYSYSWSTTPVQTTSSVTNLGPGNYTITVTDNNGCIETGQVAITEPQELILTQTWTIATCPDSEDGSINLTITGGSGPYNVVWSDGILTQNRTNIKPGTYSVVVTDQNTCAKSLVIQVGFAGSINCLVIPQVITPNNDGYNDEWRIRNIDIFPDAEVRVFNRWGKLVFKTRNLSADPWDGTFNGKLVPTDSYHYILYLNDGSAPRSGVVSVIRYKTC